MCVGSQSPDEDSLSSDTNATIVEAMKKAIASSQSPDEDSLSSDPYTNATRTNYLRSLNPLTRIHCLPTHTADAPELVVSACVSIP